MLRLSVIAGNLVILAGLVCCGCGSDDGPAAPAADTGTITIDVSPDHIDAQWVLEGPGGNSTNGAGDHTLSERKTGEYTLSWGSALGWLSPSDDSGSLAAGATLNFEGIYILDPGSTAGFARIAAGGFTMGSAVGETGRDSDERPHAVTLTKPFLLSALEVTNQQYVDLAQWALDNGYCSVTSESILDALDGSSVALMGLDDSDGEIGFDGSQFTVEAGMENRPAKNVTWFGAATYCDWMSMQAGLPRAYDHNTWECNGRDPYGAQGFRLPTEAEWEYACRAGTTSAFANGDITDNGCDDPSLDAIGWYCGNADGRTHDVGQLAANAFGLQDMHGNVMEWCNDWYAPYDGDEVDPVGGSPAKYRLARGGAWASGAGFCRSANRAGYVPEFRTDGYNVNGLGIRPARSTQ